MGFWGNNGNKGNNLIEDQDGEYPELAKGYFP